MKLPAFVKSKAFYISIGIVVLVGGGAIAFGSTRKPSFETRVLEPVDLANVVSETGSIKASESVDLAFERSGVIRRVLVTKGQTVRRGDLIAQLNAQDAVKAVRDAELDLERARVSLSKQELEQEQQQRGDSLNKEYEDGIAVLSDFYGDSPKMLSDLKEVFFEEDLSSNENNIEYYSYYNTSFKGVPERVTKLYGEIELAHEKAALTYRQAARGEGDKRRQAIEEGYSLMVKIAEIIKQGRDVVSYLNWSISGSGTSHSKQEIIDTHETTLKNYEKENNVRLTSLLAILNKTNVDKDSEASNELDAKFEELNIRQRENALTSARENLAKYSLYSPMDAVITDVDISVGESVSMNSPVVSLISQTELEVSVNVPEDNIALINSGDEAEVRLAANDDVWFPAKVVFVSPSAKVVEGVSMFEVKIQFNEKDSRVKAGLSADVNVFAEKKNGVIAIPMRSIIEERGRQFARVMVGEDSYRMQQIRLGLKGEGGLVEVVSGLKAGDRVITFAKEEKLPLREVD